MLTEILLNSLNNNKKKTYLFIKFNEIHLLNIMSNN